MVCFNCQVKKTVIFNYQNRKFALYLRVRIPFSFKGKMVYREEYCGKQENRDKGSRREFLSYPG